MVLFERVIAALKEAQLVPPRSRAGARRVGRSAAARPQRSQGSERDDERHPSSHAVHMGHAIVWLSKCMPFAAHDQIPDWHALFAHCIHNLIGFRAGNDWIVLALITKDGLIETG